MKGTLVLVKVASGLLIGQNSMDYAKTSTMIETSSKTTGNHSTFESGRISETLAVGGLASTALEATQKGYWELNAAQEAGTPVDVTFTEYSSEAGTTEVSGKEKITVSCLVSNLSLSAPDNDNITFSCDFQVTGAPTQATTV